LIQKLESLSVTYNALKNEDSLPWDRLWMTQLEIFQFSDWLTEEKQTDSDQEEEKRVKAHVIAK